MTKLLLILASFGIGFCRPDNHFYFHRGFATDRCARCDDRDFPWAGGPY
jgi:hypothetical protein